MAGQSESSFNKVTEDDCIYEYKVYLFMNTQTKNWSIDIF